MRPEKKTVDYYPHYCMEGGKTLFILENTFGNNGYAFWFKTLSLLGQSQGHFIDVYNRNAWLFLIAKTKVSEDIAENIMNLLVDLEAIDRDLWIHDRIIWCQKFVDNLESLYSRRNPGNIPQKPSLCMRYPSKCIQKPILNELNRVNDDNNQIDSNEPNQVNAYINPVNDDNKSQTKLNYSKVKETKEKDCANEDHVCESDNQQPPVESVEKSKKPKSKKEPKVKSTAVCAYRDVFNLWPNKTQEEEIDATINGQEAVARWSQICREWALRGFKPTSIRGMLDWYKGGVPASGPKHAAGKVNDTLGRLADRIQRRREAVSDNG